MELIFELEFKETAIEDLKFWAKNDLRILKKIESLLSSIKRNPYVGIGKPEALKYDLAGYWSRRINKEHRIIYAVNGEIITIHSMRFHYDRKLN